MTIQKNLMAYFNNQSKFNGEDEHLRSSLKNNTAICKTIDIIMYFLMVHFLFIMLVYTILQNTLQNLIYHIH
jgi:hypothetical protein